jgi:uncharacterized protein
MAALADDEVVRSVLELPSWAIVGCSPDPQRPSHGVAEFLLRHGKQIFPVNPACETILEQRCYPTLGDVPAEVRVDVVDLFRRSELVGHHIDEAIERGVGAVWTQLGVVDRAAAARARAAGLFVVVDRCPRIEWPRFLPAARSTDDGGGRL